MLCAIWNNRHLCYAVTKFHEHWEGNLFEIPKKTRWNLTCDSMIRVNEFLQKQKHALTSIFIVFDIRPINEAEQTFLPEFLLVMKLLAISLDILQGAECASAGFLLPTLFNVEEEWASALKSG